MRARRDEGVCRQQIFPPRFKVFGIAGGHDHGLGVAVPQQRLIVASVFELTGTPFDLVLQTLDILIEFVLLFLDDLGLFLERHDLLEAGVVLLFQRFVVITARHQRLFRFLERHVLIVRRSELAERDLQLGDDVIAFLASATVKVVDFLLPFLDVIDLLIDDVVVYLEPLDPGLLEQILHQRGNDLLLDLVYPQRGDTAAAVIRDPVFRDRIIAHPRAGTQNERSGVFRLVEIKILLPQTGDLIFGDLHGIMVVRRIERIQQRIPAGGQQFADGRDLRLADQLDVFAEFHNEFLQEGIQLDLPGRQFLLHLVDLVEVLEIVSIRIVVENVQDRNIVGPSDAILVEEIDIFALRRNDGERHGIVGHIIQEVGRRTQIAIDLPQMVVHGHVFERRDQMAGGDALRRVAAFRDGRVRFQVPQILNRGHEILIFADLRQPEFLFPGMIGVVEDETFSVERHFRRDRHIRDAQFADRVIPLDRLKFLIQFEQFVLRVQFFLIRALYLEDSDNDRNEQPEQKHDQQDAVFPFLFRLFDGGCKFGLPGIDAVLFRNDLLRRFAEILKSDFRFIIIDIQTVGEYLALQEAGPACRRTASRTLRRTGLFGTAALRILRFPRGRLERGFVLFHFRISFSLLYSRKQIQRKVFRRAARRPSAWSRAAKSSGEIPDRSSDPSSTSPAWICFSTSTARGESAPGMLFRSSASASQSRRHPRKSSEAASSITWSSFTVCWSRRI